MGLQVSFPYPLIPGGIARGVRRAETATALISSIPSSTRFDLKGVPYSTNLAYRSTTPPVSRVFIISCSSNPLPSPSPPTAICEEHKLNLSVIFAFYRIRRSATLADRAKQKAKHSWDWNRWIPTAIQFSPKCGLEKMSGMIATRIRSVRPPGRLRKVEDYLSLVTAPAGDRERGRTSGQRHTNVERSLSGSTKRELLRGMRDSWRSGYEECKTRAYAVQAQREETGRVSEAVYAGGIHDRSVRLPLRSPALLDVAVTKSSGVLCDPATTSDSGYKARHHAHAATRAYYTCVSSLSECL
ncbi:hypothetical protein J6590_064289 [Homalodisca vitripennis]|nr:hypothetical protein J6590_064289 [Homalodisca vitripennis]